MGISESGLQNLFIEFNKLQENEHVNKIGTGLGLSICKSIVESIGGKIHCSSQLQKGTTFEMKFVTWCKLNRNKMIE